MTPSCVPSLKDLVTLFLKERYPYWKFTGDDAFDGNAYLFTDRGTAAMIIYKDEVQLMNGQYIEGTIKAAEPDFLDRLAKHVLDIKREELRR